MIVRAVGVGTEPIDAGPREALNRGPVDGILQPRERRLGAEGRAAVTRHHLKRRIMAEPVGVVDILVPRGDLIQPLADQRVQVVADVARVARVGDPPDDIVAEPQLLIELSDESRPASVVSVPPANRRRVSVGIRSQVAYNTL